VEERAGRLAAFGEIERQAERACHGETRQGAQITRNPQEQGHSGDHGKVLDFESEDAYGLV
jgi:hypothetical protein